MPLNRFLHLIIIIICTITFSLVWGDQDLWGSTLPLDDEAVFCIYLKMSNKVLDDQDMEDFSSKAGRPAFTEHKPSEMFVKQSLARLRERLLEKIRDFKDDSLFRWTFKCKLGSNNTLILDRKKMPQPTPYISSDMSEKDWGSVRRELSSLVAKKLNSAKRGELEISVLLRPEVIDYRFQNRNVAHEDIVLPIRCVIFHPVRVEVFDEIMTIKRILH